MSGGFRIQNQRLLLTYKTHLEKAAVIGFIESIHKTTFIRCAHETGKHENEEEGYPHTHVLVDFGRAFQTTNCRKFDIGDIHPHIEAVKSRLHLTNAKRYLAKEDPENADLREEKSGIVERVWSQESVQDALMTEVKRPSDAMGIIQLYKAKPAPEYTAPVPENWREWQAELIRLLEGPVNDREIIWVCDTLGGKGKTVLARYIEDHMNGILLTQMGGARDTATILKSEPSLDGRIIVIDLPRQAQDKDIYSPIEMMKNGRMTAIKYEGGRMRWRPGHIVVMANFEPDRSKWSQDRYRVISL